MRPVIAFDEIHGETWTTDLLKAIEMKPLQPEYHFYGHVADIAADATGGQCTRVTNPGNALSLPSSHVLVIAHPSEPAKETNTGGTPVFQQDEIRALVNHVAAGGGLFVLGEWSCSRWGNNLNEILAMFGMQFNDDTLVSSRGSANAHLISRHFICSDINDEHPVTDGVHQITYHRGCSIECLTGHSAKGIVFAPGGKTVAAAADYGRGRVVAIGDTDLFSIPFIGHCDNARLLARIFQWLTRSQSEHNSHRLIRSKSYPLLQSESGLDISLKNGDHVLDCRKLLAGTSENQVQGMPHPYANPGPFLEQAALAFHELPKEIRQRVLRFKNEGNEYGVLLLRGLPADSNPPQTPVDSKRSKEKSTWTSEFWLSVFAEGLGDAISYAQEKDGEIFQNLCPTRKNEKALSSESSTITLDFHTEVAFHPHLPDFLLLYCIRQDHDKEAQTFFASTRHIVQQIPLKYRATLFEDVFQTGIDYSFGSQSGLKANGPKLAVLNGNPYSPTMKFDLDLMAGLSESAGKALEEMKKAVNNSKNFVKLQPGDLLIIDNKRAVHGRSFFTPRYDGYDRWLQRVFVVRDLTASEEERQRGERIIETEFIL